MAAGPYLPADSILRTGFDENVERRTGHAGQHTGVTKGPLKDSLSGKGREAKKGI